MKHRISIIPITLIAALVMAAPALADEIGDTPIAIGISPETETTAAAKGAGASASGQPGASLETSASDLSAASADSTAAQQPAAGVIEISAEPAASSDKTAESAGSSGGPQPSISLDTGTAAGTDTTAAAASADTVIPTKSGVILAPVQVNSLGEAIGSLTGPSVISAGSTSVTASAVSSGNGVPGSIHANDPRGRVELGYTLVSPNVDFGGFQVAEGSVQLADGSWEMIGKEGYIRYAYFMMLREQTDSSGTPWYVVRPGGRQIGSYRTSDGSVPSELWLKKSDCTAQSYLDLNTTNVTRQQIVKNALSLLGRKYQYGGNGPEAFDCSGFVNYVMSTVGISVPRTSSEICNAGTQVGIEGLRPGDIVGRVGHVGIYIGDGNFVHASESSTGVIVESVEVYQRTNRFTSFANVVGD